MSANFQIEDMLPELGFGRKDGELAAWQFCEAGLELGVVDGLNRFFAPVLSFAGHFSDGRRMQLFEFSIGKYSASREEALEPDPKLS